MNNNRILFRNCTFNIFWMSLTTAAAAVATTAVQLMRIGNNPCQNGEE